MANKKFTAARRDLNRKEPFDLESFDSEGNSVLETFWCYPGRAPGGVLFDAIVISSNGSAGFWEFWQAVMDESEYTKFYAFIRSSKHPVEAPLIRTIMDWVIEESTARPTEQPAT